MKHVKYFKDYIKENIMSAEPTTKPTPTKEPDTKPSKPRHSPIRRDKPDVEPKPKAKLKRSNSEQVTNEFIKELHKKKELAKNYINSK